MNILKELDQIWHFDPLFKFQSALTPPVCVCVCVWGSSLKHVYSSPVCDLVLSPILLGLLWHCIWDRWEAFGHILKEWWAFPSPSQRPIAPIWLPGPDLAHFDQGGVVGLVPSPHGNQDNCAFPFGRGLWDLRLTVFYYASQLRATSINTFCQNPPQIPCSGR